MEHYYTANRNIIFTVYAVYSFIRSSGKTTVSVYVQCLVTASAVTYLQTLLRNTAQKLPNLAK